MDVPDFRCRQLVAGRKRQRRTAVQVRRKSTRVAGFGERSAPEGRHSGLHVQEELHQQSELFAEGYFAAMRDRQPVTGGEPDL